LIKRNDNTVNLTLQTRADKYFAVHENSVGEQLPPLKVQGMAQAIENGT
jgi:hypothetical protein